MKRFKFIGLLLVVLAIATACSSVPKFGAVISDTIASNSYEIEFSIKAVNDLNPTIEGRPSPLQITVFQLQDDSDFITSTTDDLLSNAAVKLGGALIASDQTMIFPGMHDKWRLDIDNKARYIAIVAAFQREQGQSKAIVEIEGSWSRDLCIQFDTSSVQSARSC